jgi:DNA-binding MarR family transcriptional regulator
MPDFQAGGAGAPASRERVRSAFGPTGLDPMIEAKLWANPCWFTFRLNYLALRYNVPLYGWVQRKYGLARPEFVVIYSLGLKDGALARDISRSSGFPKNTLSRAIHRLAKGGLVRRERDPGDARSQVLRLTGRGRAIFDEALPAFVEFERQMLRTLDEAERRTLSRLLAKIVLDSVNWPEGDFDGEGSGAV